MNRSTLVRTVAALVITCSLAGCASPTAPEASTSRANSPTPEATKTPEANKFTGTIDYDRLTGETWKNYTEAEQLASCGEFFSQNIEKEATVSPESTGSEVIDWYKKRLLVLQSLSADKTNPLNYDAALNLADCLTVSVAKEETGFAGKKFLKGQVTSLHQSSIEGAEFVYIEPTQVTRYSDGIFPETPADGVSYMMYAVEGYDNTGIGNQKGDLVMDYFTWSP